MPRKILESEPISEGEHVFTEWACDCGRSWPKTQGKTCPDCGTVKP